MKTHNYFPLLLALAMVAPSIAAAQQTEREREMQEAERKVEEAQRQLEEALRDLRAAERDDANRALREALESLRSAQRELRSGAYRGLLSRLYVSPEGDRRVNILMTGRPRMGVILKTGSSDTVGAVLEAVTPGGPADEAGLEAGDILVSANGKSLRRVGRRDDMPGEKLVDIIGELEEGDTLAVEYLRDGERRSAAVIVRELEPSSYAFSWSGDSGEVFLRAWPEIRAMPDIDVEVPRFDPIEYSAPMIARAFLPFGWLNMELVRLDDDLGEYFGTTEGLLVVRAPKDEDIGLKSGDVILSIDGRKPTSPSHALRIMRSYEAGESMNVEVMRAKRRQTVTVTIPERERGFFWHRENR